MSKNFVPSRRDLLKGGGALIVGFSLAGRSYGALAQGTAKPLALTAVDTFLAINSAGAMTVYSGKVPHPFVRCSPIKSSAEWEGAASEPCRVSNVR